MTRASRRIAGLALLWLALILPAAAGDDDRDHRRAGDAVRDGRARPLAEILRIVRPQLGEILEVELDEDDGVLVYEIKYLDRRGRRMEAEIDARTGRILEREEDD